MATLMGSFRPPSCRSMVRATLTRVSRLEHALSRLLRAGAPDSVLFSRAHEALATPFSSAGATGLGCVIRNRSTWLEVCQVMIRFGLEQMRVVLRNLSRAKLAARVGTSTRDVLRRLEQTCTGGGEGWFNERAANTKAARRRRRRIFLKQQGVDLTADLTVDLRA